MPNKITGHRTKEVKPTDIHPTEFPDVSCEVHDSVKGFWFRVRVGDKVSPWTYYEGIAVVEDNGAAYIAHSAYWAGHIFSDVTEMTVLKVTKLVNKPGVLVNR